MPPKPRPGEQGGGQGDGPVGRQREAGRADGHQQVRAAEDAPVAEPAVEPVEEQDPADPADEVGAQPEPGGGRREPELRRGRPGSPGRTGPADAPMSTKPTQEATTAALLNTGPAGAGERRATRSSITRTPEDGPPCGWAEGTVAYVWIRRLMLPVTSGASTSLGQPGARRDIPGCRRGGTGTPRPSRDLPVLPPTPKIHQGCPVPVRVREQDRTRADHARARRTTAATGNLPWRHPQTTPRPRPPSGLWTSSPRTPRTRRLWTRSPTATCSSPCPTTPTTPTPPTLGGGAAGAGAAGRRTGGARVHLRGGDGRAAAVGLPLSPGAPRRARRPVAGRRPVAHHRRQLRAPPDTHLGGCPHPAGPMIAGRTDADPGRGRRSAQRPFQRCPLQRQHLGVQVTAPGVRATHTPRRSSTHTERSPGLPSPAGRSAVTARSG